jgi:hypothetical protein
MFEISLAPVAAGELVWTAAVAAATAGLVTDVAASGAA